MADATGRKAPKKSPAKKKSPAPPGQGGSPSRKTMELARKLAVAVIREHGLPEEIKADLRAAGVPDEILESVGGSRSYVSHPHTHTSSGYKKKKP